MLEFEGDLAVQLTVENHQGIAIVTLLGKSLDASNAKEFKRSLVPVIEEYTQVIFDLSKLEFVDSSGFGGILSALRQLNGKGGDLKLCSLTKTVRVLFELVRMHRLFEIFNTREEALSAFTNQ